MGPITKLSTAFLSLLLLSACGERPRTCPLFDHPSEPLWDPAVPGDVVVFANQLGGEIRYELKSTVDDVASAAPTRSNCAAFSTSHYYDDIENIGFRVTLEHSIPDNGVNTGLPLEQQFLYYALRTVKESTTFRDESEFILSNLSSEFNNASKGRAVYQYAPTRTINGVAYSDVLERDFSAYEDIVSYFADYPAEAAWVRVVVAKNVGLLQYELLNGEIYTRLLSPGPS